MQEGSDTPEIPAYDATMPPLKGPRKGPGRHRKDRDLKKPSEYPYYAFRVSEDDEAALNLLIEQVMRLMDSKRKFGDPQVSRSSVLAKAVDRGLKQLKKIHSR